jgi:hypothetical protein
MNLYARADRIVIPTDSATAAAKELHHDYH